MLIRTSIVAFLSLFVCWVPEARGQTLEWTRQLMLQAETLGSQGFRVATDPQGDIYISGQARFEDTYWDGVSAKFDPSGTIQWTRHLPSTFDPEGSFNLSSEDSEDISIDSLGSVYVAGRTNGSLVGTNAGGHDAILASYDSGGNLQWLRQFGSSDSDYGDAVWPDGSGHVYMAGATSGSLAATNAGRQDVYLAKFDSSGANQWIRQFGTSEYDNPARVTGDGFGHVFIAGDTRGSLEGTNAGARDAFIAMYDSDGAHQWTQQFGSIEDDFIRDAATDLQGNVYLVGHTYGNLGGTNAGGIDTILAKYDGSGFLQWTRQIGTDALDIGTGITIDEFGGIYIAGYTRGDLGGTNAGLYDAFISKFDPSGGLQWIQQFGTSDSERPNGIDVDAMGNLYVAGITVRAADGFEDPFLTKFSDLAVPEPTSRTLVCLAAVAVFGISPGRRRDRT